MGAHYRHTTPEMAARVVTAIRARLTVLVHAAEDTLERSRPTCHAPCSDSYGPLLAGKQHRAAGVDNHHVRRDGLQLDRIAAAQAGVGEDRVKDPLMGGGDPLSPDDALDGSIVKGGVLAEDGRVGLAVAACPCLPHAVEEGANGRFVLRRELAAVLHGPPCPSMPINHRVSLPRTSGLRAGGATGGQAARLPGSPVQVGVWPPKRSPCAVVVLTASTHLGLRSAGIV